VTLKEATEDPLGLGALMAGIKEENTSALQGCKDLGIDTTPFLKDLDIAAKRTASEKQSLNRIKHWRKGPRAGPGLSLDLRAALGTPELRPESI
jgi:hypothetical protein